MRLRSWGMRSSSAAVNTSHTMDRDSSSLIPFLQQALLSRYRWILGEVLEAPPWYRSQMGSSELDELCPLVYQVLPSIYGTTSSSSKKKAALLNSSLDLRQQYQNNTENLKPIPIHQIFNINNEDDSSRTMWLEGESNSGKSFFCLKLLHEWISYHTYNYTSTPLNTRIGEFQVIFYVPLNQVRGSLTRFLLKELFPKQSVASRMKASTLLKALNQLGSSLLIILDGLDDVLNSENLNLKNKESQDSEILKDIESLLNGQLFPQSMVLVTSKPSPTINMNSLCVRSVRKFLVNGMEWGQIQFFVRRFFTGRKFSGCESRLCEILSERDDLLVLASNPFILALLCAVFEEVGDIPYSNAELYATLLGCLFSQTSCSNSSNNNKQTAATTSSYGSGSGSSSSTSTSSPSFRHGKEPSNGCIPSKYQKQVQDFGKLVLTKMPSANFSKQHTPQQDGLLEPSRIFYTEQEVLAFCGNLDLVKLGLLSRSKAIFVKPKKSQFSASKKLTLIHPSLTPFVAAYYLQFQITSPQLLRKELDLLPDLDQLQQNQVRIQSILFQVLGNLMELLQNKGACLFLTLSLLDTSLNYLLALLRSAGFYEANLRAVCSLIKSVNLKHITVNLGSEWVSEYKQVISSPHCSLESVEIIIRPGYSAALSRIIEGLCQNESVTSIKFSSIPGSEWNPVEVNLLSAQLHRLMCFQSMGLNKKLRSLEIIMTCLEDKEHSRFQPVVDALSLALGESKGGSIFLKKLVLDMDLTSVQLVQLVEFIKSHPSLEVLHLPHLGCGPEGFHALAQLLQVKPLLSLSLMGSWRSNSAEQENQVVLEPFPFPNLVDNFSFNDNVSNSLSSNKSSLQRLNTYGGSMNGIKSPSIRRKKGYNHSGMIYPPPPPGPTVTHQQQISTPLLGSPRQPHQYQLGLPSPPQTQIPLQIQVQNSQSNQQMRQTTISPAASPMLGVLVLPPLTTTNSNSTRTSSPQNLSPVSSLSNSNSLNNNTNHHHKSNSELRRNFLPVPICDRANHELDGFHSIFSVLRSTSPHLLGLRTLNLSKCVMNWEDVICLGETVRKMDCLHSLRMEGMKLCDVLPVLLALQENTSLKMADLSSNHVVIGDDAIQLVTNSLAKNSTLRLLSIQGWTMYIQEERTLETLESFFATSALQDLDLSSVRMHVNLNQKSKSSSSKRPETPTTPTPTKSNPSTLRKGSGGLGFSFGSRLLGHYSNNSNSSGGSTTSLNTKGTSSNFFSSFSTKICPKDLSYLRLGGMTLEPQKSTLLKSPEIFAYLLPQIDRSKITYLDISIDKLDLIPSALTSDKLNPIETFKLIKQLPRLQTLIMKNWRFKYSNHTLNEKCFKEMAKSVSSLIYLCVLNMDNCSVICEEDSSNSSNSNSSSSGGRFSSAAGKGKRLDVIIPHYFLPLMKNLKEFSWTNFDLGGSCQTLHLAKTLCDLNSLNVPLQFKMEFVPLRALKELVSACGGRVEYIGNHTVQVQTRSKTIGIHEGDLMYKIKRRFLD
ncbi:uncharacterized protein LOC110843073 isoform X3 [Folsomia candida]|nr:uncharacterized protein LOC110843073 isoform X3 [Folsomia candida]XP_035703111.1 uncharacterized protein LOC110843073 isoform X3 [Folsomia candida]